MFELLACAALALSAEPIWAGNGARYALFRREVHLPADRVQSATMHVAAAQSGPLEKLLGAYRLYVDGVAIGIGPGRGDVRTAAYPDGGEYVSSVTRTRQCAVSGGCSPT